MTPDYLTKTHESYIGLQPPEIGGRYVVFCHCGGAFQAWFQRD